MLQLMDDLFADFMGIRNVVVFVCRLQVNVDVVQKAFHYLWESSFEKRACPVIGGGTMLILTIKSDRVSEVADQRFPSRRKNLEFLFGCSGIAVHNPHCDIAFGGYQLHTYMV